MSEEKEYGVTDAEDISHVAIKVKDGIFKDVKFRYGTVKVEEDKENDVCRLNFEFNVEEAPPPYNIQSLENDDTFKKYAGDILVDILSDTAAQIGKMNE